jgi:hypothetical protein
MNPQVWFVVGMLFLWCGADWCRNHQGTPSEVSTLIVSQAGRDQAILRLIHEARISVYLRTERLTLVPAGNELVQAIQRKASVTVDLPVESGCDAEAARLPGLLMEQGAVVSFRGDPVASNRGTFLVVDGTRFLYSAMPLALSMPGAQVSYVIGPLGR